MKPRGAGHARGLLGLILMVVGLVILGVSGFYTATAFVAALPWKAAWLAIAVLVFGAVPMVVGFLTFRAGRRLWATPRPRRIVDVPAGENRG